MLPTTYLPKGNKKRRTRKMPNIVKCPKCASTNVVEKKTWKLEGGIRTNKFIVHLCHCEDCGKTFRKLTPA
jgi:hypothetical protein